MTGKSSVKVHVLERGERAVLLERRFDVDGREVRAPAEIERRHIAHASRCQPGHEVTVQICDMKLAELGWLE